MRFIKNSLLDKKWNLIGKLITLLFLQGIGFSAQANLLRVAVGNPELNFIPQAMPNQTTLWISRQTNCQLTRLVDGEVRGEAAESFHFDSGNRLIFKLKPQITFSDGSLLSEADAAASLEFYIKNRPYVRNTFSWIRKVSYSKSTHEVIIDYTQNGNALLKSLSVPLFSIYKASSLKSKKAKDWFMPVGCGAYSIKSRSKTELIIQHRTHPDQQVSFSFIENNELEKKSAETYDLVAVPVISDDLSRSDFSKITIDDPYQIYVGMNTKKKKWANKNDRCNALSRFDSFQISHSFGQDALVANDYYPKGTFGYDPRASDKMLTRSGSAFNPSEAACMATLRVSIPKSQEINFQKNASFPIKQIKPILNAADFKAEFNKTDCDFLVIGLKSNSLDGYEFQLLFSEKATNFTNYDNAQLSDLIKKTQLVKDKQDRYLSYRKIADQISDACVIRPLITIPGKRIFVRNKYKIKGIGFAALNDILLDWNQDES